MVMLLLGFFGYLRSILNFSRKRCFTTAMHSHLPEHHILSHAFMLPDNSNDFHWKENKFLTLS